MYHDTKTLSNKLLWITTSSPHPRPNPVAPANSPGWQPPLGAFSIHLSNINDGGPTHHGSYGIGGIKLRPPSNPVWALSQSHKYWIWCRRQDNCPIPLSTPLYNDNTDDGGTKKCGSYNVGRRKLGPPNNPAWARRQGNCLILTLTPVYNGKDQVVPLPLGMHEYETVLFDSETLGHDLLINHVTIPISDQPCFVETRVAAYEKVMQIRRHILSIWNSLSHGHSIDLEASVLPHYQLYI